MTKLVIFDVDGTTLDTIKTITYHANKALGQYGMAPFEPKDTQAVLGYSSVFLIESMIKMRGFQYDQAKLKEILDLYHKMYQADVAYLTEAYEGIIDLLIYLREKGYLLASLSNKPDHTLSILFEKLDFGKYFDFSMGQRDYIPKKPDPHMVDYLIDKFELNKEDVIFVGDTEVDYETAVNAGVKFIGVSWGFRERKVLEDLKCELLADDVDQLKAMIEEG